LAAPQGQALRLYVHSPMTIAPYSTRRG